MVNSLKKSKIKPELRDNILNLILNNQNMIINLTKKLFSILVKGDLQNKFFPCKKFLLENILRLSPIRKKTGFYLKYDINMTLKLLVTQRS